MMKYEKILELYKDADKLHNLAAPSYWEDADCIKYAACNKLAFMTCLKLIRQTGVISDISKFELLSITGKIIETENMDYILDYNEEAQDIVEKLLSSCGFDIEYMDIYDTIRSGIVECYGEEAYDEFNNYGELSVELDKSLDVLLDYCKNEFCSYLGEGLWKRCEDTVCSYICDIIQRMYIVDHMYIVSNPEIGKILYNSEKIGFGDKPEVLLLKEAAAKLAVSQYVQFAHQGPSGYEDGSYSFIIMCCNAYEPAEYVNFLHMSWGYLTDAAVCNELVKLIKVKYPQLLSKGADICEKAVS